MTHEFVPWVAKHALHLSHEIVIVELLVASHIKRRSECSRGEKKDYRNNVLAMCRCGCDELFELGYIVVDQQGLVQMTFVAYREAPVERSHHPRQPLPLDSSRHHVVLLTVRKQTLINSTSPMLAKDPQVADPFAIRPHRPDDVGSQYGDPRKMPPCSSTGSSDGVQSPPLISSTTV